MREARKNTKLKPIVRYIDMLENMQIILTDGGELNAVSATLDEFELGLKKLKTETREAKNMLKDRQEELEKYKGRTSDTVSIPLSVFMHCSNEEDDWEQAGGVP